MNARYESIAKKRKGKKPFFYGDLGKVFPARNPPEMHGFPPFKNAKKMWARVEYVVVIL